MTTRGDSLLRFNERNFWATIKYCDESYYSIFSPKLTEGEWFRDFDEFEIPSALITQKLADEMGLTGRATGQIIYYSGRPFRISGVVEAFKLNPAGHQISALFLPFSTPVESEWGWQYAVKYREGQGADFSRALIAEFYRNFPRDQFQPLNIDLNKMANQDKLLQFSLQFYAFGVPIAFMLIFAFMGTFGVIWMQSKKRMSEFGVRIAFGCTPARLMCSVIFENLKLTIIAMLPGLIVAAFLYAYAPKGPGWLIAVGAAVVLMLLFSAISAWYPAWKASRVQPVEALKANQ
jgi:ABC-type antimicrobial peptide transport system permease subunit